MESDSTANVDISKFLPPDTSKKTKCFVRRECSGFLLRMLEEGVHADVTVTAKGGSVKAHHCVLSCVSPVFSAMFRRDMKEQITASVDIPDMTIDALQLFLLVLYTVNEDGTSQNGMHRYFIAAIDKHFIEFHDAVREYQVEGSLQYFLEYALLRNLSPKNCWYLYEYAQLSESPISDCLEELCFCYIMWNYLDVIRCTETLEKMKRDPDHLHDLLVQAMTAEKRKAAIQWFDKKKLIWEEWEANQE